MCTPSSLEEVSNAAADEAHMPVTKLRNVMCYETLLEAAASRLPFTWLATDEEAACGLCYTSGTTGNPKVHT